MNADQMKLSDLTVCRNGRAIDRHGRDLGPCNLELEDIQAQLIAVTAERDDWEKRWDAERAVKHATQERLDKAEARAERYREALEWYAYDPIISYHGERARTALSNTGETTDA